MGSIKVRNPLLSKKLKRTETRLLIIDDNQIRFNQICEQLTANEHRVQAYLLDDIKNFEKQLHLTWDLVIFGRAYDLKVDQALTLIRASQQPNLPLLLLKPDDYNATQYTSYVRKGIYDIINLDYPERFYFGLIRALSFSRLQQSQEQLMTELENAQSQAQALVEDSSKAVAIIQEGIHAQANAEYLQLFGLKSEDDLIGLPLLDLLQPQDITDFKFRFKKVSQGQFEHGRFDIHSQNPLLAKQNPLKIEFVGAADDAIQITIDIENTAQNTVPAQTTADKAAAKPSTYQLVNRTLAKQPSNANALVVFSLANCPESIFQADWQTTKNYFANIRNFLKEQTNVPLFNVSNGLVVGLFQAESPAILESKLIGLNSLTKPQLLTVDQHSYPLNLRIGYVPLTQDIQNESSFEQLISQGFANALPQPQEHHNSGLALDLSFGESNLNVIESAAAVPQSYSESTIISAIRQSLDRGEIHLKYQQLYDKQDTNLYTYEVTSGFIFNSEWKTLTGLIDLAEDPELAIKLDRWILVESCKQLHNFITQYPEAKLIVNLNKFVLLQDRSFPEFVSKLITIIGSPLTHPLILQFSEEDISQNLGDAQKQISLLRQYGAEISLRDFGHSIYSESILKQVDIHYLTLHSALTEKLAADDSTQELQKQLSIYSEIKPVEVLLRDLNDMNLFANAWNVDARFIQGDYFQKKLDHLIDVQDQ